MYLGVEFFVDPQLDPHVAKQLHGGGDVVQVGNVADCDRPVGQQGSRKNRQCCILRPRDSYLAIKGATTGNDQFIHNIPIQRCAPLFVSSTADNSQETCSLLAVAHSSGV